MKRLELAIEKKKYEDVDRILGCILKWKEGLVIDPYCGSGTTLVAAKILDHNFIGIEISEKYIEFAENRLKNYKEEEIYAREERTKHIVAKTFKERKEKGEFTGKYWKNNEVESNLKILKLFDRDK